MAFPTSVENFYFRRGKFYTTACVTDDVEVAKLVSALRKENSELPSGQKKIVWILSGTHGDPDGNLVRHRDFFFEDKALEGQLYKAVNVFGFHNDDGSMNKLRWNEYIGKTGIVVLAWCYSEKSRTGWMKNANIVGL